MVQVLVLVLQYVTCIEYLVQVPYCGILHLQYAYYSRTGDWIWVLALVTTTATRRSSNRYKYGITDTVLYSGVSVRASDNTGTSFVNGGGQIKTLSPFTELGVELHTPVYAYVVRVGVSRASHPLKSQSRVASRQSDVLLIARSCE